jgi:hypothetical protein
VITGEHEFEAEYGLPAPLPTGERLLWQGQPDGATLAREALHWRKLALYFSVILAWRAGFVLVGGGTGMQALVAAAWLLPLAVFAIGIALGLASLIRRTTVYTVTDRRVVMRIGIVLTVTFNLPYRAIDGASLRLGARGHGDIVLTINGESRVGYIHLWPHARPWHVRSPQPMLRALPDAQRVAALLARALQASAALAPLESTPGQASAIAPAPKAPSHVALEPRRRPQPEARAA